MDGWIDLILLYNQSLFLNMPGNYSQFYECSVRISAFRKSFASLELQTSQKELNSILLDTLIFSLRGRPLINESTFNETVFVIQ